MYRYFEESVVFNTDDEYCIKDRKGTGVGGINVKVDFVGGSHVYLRAMRKGSVGRNGTTVSSFMLTIPKDPRVLREIGRVFMGIADKLEESENE